MKHFFTAFLAALLFLAGCPDAFNAAIGAEFGSGMMEFGSWEQDGDAGNGPEPIEWLSVENRDGATVLISACTLDVRPFNAKAANVTWGTCSLRKWLNGEFFRNAFSEGEQTSILAVSVPADPNPQTNADPGKSTKDRVFIPSLDEVERWFGSDEERACPPSLAVVDKTPYIKDGLSPWWLRTPGKDNKNVALVTQKGKAYAKGGPVHDKRAPVRVCIVLGGDAGQQFSDGAQGAGGWDAMGGSGSIGFGGGQPARPKAPAAPTKKPKYDKDGWEILE